MYVLEQLPFLSTIAGSSNIEYQAMIQCRNIGAAYGSQGDNERQKSGANLNVPLALGLIGWSMAAPAAW